MMALPQKRPKITRLQELCRKFGDLMNFIKKFRKRIAKIWAKENPQMYIDFFRYCKDRSNILHLSLTRLKSITTNWSVEHIAFENKIIIHKLRADEELLLRILNHEYLHAVLFRLEGVDTCKALDKKEFEGTWWVN
jgi:hypothetical protein